MIRDRATFELLDRDELLEEVLRLRGELDEQLKVGADRARQILRLTPILERVEAWVHAPYGEGKAAFDELARGLARYHRELGSVTPRRWWVPAIDPDVWNVTAQGQRWHRSSTDPDKWLPVTDTGVPLSGVVASTWSLVAAEGGATEVRPEACDGRR